MRAGLLAPLAESQDDYGATSLIGPFYSAQLRGLGALRDIPFEVGLDVSGLESADGSVEAVLLLFRFDLLFSKWQAFRQSSDFYGLCGFEVVSSDASEGEAASGLNLGFGRASVRRQWDARLTYSVLMGSSNIQGLLLLTGGYRF